MKNNKIYYWRIFFATIIVTQTAFLSTIITGLFFYTILKIKDIDIIHSYTLFTCLILSFLFALLFIKLIKNNTRKNFYIFVTTQLSVNIVANFILNTKINFSNYIYFLAQLIGFVLAYLLYLKSKKNFTYTNQQEQIKVLREF